MNKIRWTESNWNGITNYNAKVGDIQLCCRPSTKRSRNGKRHIVGWTCFIYYGDRHIDHTKREKPLEFVQKEAEKLTVQYLLGYGFAAIRALKRLGLLEEMLLEVGVET